MHRANNGYRNNRRMIYRCTTDNLVLNFKSDKPKLLKVNQENCQQKNTYKQTIHHGVVLLRSSVESSELRVRCFIHRLISPMHQT